MSQSEIFTLIKAEAARQKKQHNLIPSENQVSKDVLKALGSVLVNKYAEGYPGRRYYNGNEVVDQIETLAQKRALEMFKLSPKKWSANVQPLSGSPANLAVYQALVPHGAKIMCMRLDHGGHLSHGHGVTITGKLWKQVVFGVDEKTQKLDYEAIREIALKEKPAMIVVGFTAYPRKINFKKFRDIADECGALLHADISHIAGLVAGKAHPSPFPHADTVMTTTHKTLRGPRGALIISREEHAAKVNKAVFPGLQGGPHLNKIAAMVVAFEEALEPEFKEYANQVVANAKALAKTLKSGGLKLVSGGTDNHLLLVDVWKGGEGITGKEAADKLEEAGIIVNRNTVPFDSRSPMDPSGIRLGTPFETTKGATEEDMIKLGERIVEVVKNDR